jgi:hypothetical protein
MTLKNLVMKIAISLIAMIYISLACLGQEWKTYKTNDEMKVTYYKDNENKKFYINIQHTTKHSVIELINNIKDVENYPQWVSNCAGAKIIERYGNDSLYYYTRNEPPFPLSKKDAIFLVKINYATNGSIKVYNKSTPNKLPLTDGYERVDHYIVEWEFIPNKEYTTVNYKVETAYPAHTPEFALNQFIEKGPVLSVNKFLEKLD